MSDRRQESLPRKARSTRMGPHDDRRWAARQESQRFEEQESELAAAREEHFAAVASGRPDDCDRIAHRHILALLRLRHG